MVELVLAFALGVACTFLAQFLVVVRRLNAREKPMNIVDAENVIRIRRWEERRRETDETFGRRA
jgi:hypothetical protein